MRPPGERPPPGTPGPGFGGPITGHGPPRAPFPHRLSSGSAEGPRGRPCSQRVAPPNVGGGGGGATSRPPKPGGVLRTRTTPVWTGPPGNTALGLRVSYRLFGADPPDSEPGRVHKGLPGSGMPRRSPISLTPLLASTVESGVFPRHPSEAPWDCQGGCVMQDRPDRQWAGYTPGASGLPSGGGSKSPQIP